MLESTLPNSAKQFRNILEKSRLGDIRIWKDSITCFYQNVNDAYNYIFQAENNMFLETMPSEYIRIIKEGFIQGLKKYSYPLKVSYDFVGSTGIAYK